MNNVKKNFVLFFVLNMGVQLIHACNLYSNKYGTLFQNFNCAFAPPTFLYKMKALTKAVSRCCNTTLQYHFNVSCSGL